MLKVTRRENAEHYTWGGICDGWHLLKSSALSVIQESVPPGAGEQRHFHQQAHQFFFVLSGEATMEVNDQTLVIGPQQGLSVPPGQPHRLVNESGSELTFIVISAPESHGDRMLID